MNTYCYHCDSPLYHDELNEKISCKCSNMINCVSCGNILDQESIRRKIDSHISYSLNMRFILNYCENCLNIICKPTNPLSSTMCGNLCCYNDTINLNDKLCFLHLHFDEDVKCALEYEDY